MAPWRAAFRAARVHDTIDYFRGEAEINWIHAHQREVWAATDKFLLLSGYLNWRLCGRFADCSGELPSSTARSSTGTRRPPTRRPPASLARAKARS